MIFGLTGSIGSGKGAVADILKEKGFAYFSLSDELREVCKKQGIEPTRENLQNKGNRLRKEVGSEILAILTTSRIKNDALSDIVIDSIRNPAEVEYLRENLDNFFLLGIDASQKVRYSRLVERAREGDSLSWDKFLEADSRDRGEEEKSGQAVGSCLSLADNIIYNDGSLEDLAIKVSSIYESIKPKHTRPSWDRYFMDIAASVAKRATCDRGRSGCVIAKNKQILVTGYVGSPPGFPHCDEIGHQMKTLKHEDGNETRHCVRTTHAEQNAISQAAKLGIPLEGSTLYCNMTPCTTCARLILTSGIKKVVCEKKYHAGAESEEMFRKANVPIEFFSNSLQKYKDQ